MVGFLIGARIEKTQKKKYLLLLGLVYYLGILGFFKYCNFFIDTANALFTNLGFHVGTLSILLPIGISFYTLQSIGYLIDVYRGKLSAERDFLDFALFTGLFPQLISGPIVRATELLPQLKRGIFIKKENLSAGLQIFVFGLVKKLVIADRCAVFTENVFSAPHLYDTPTLWLAVFGYSIQIFCDFSGYTDMAIGAARCMGLIYPENFQMPYVARSVTEFWRRWHQTLSFWLRDYLYIPLGGNRRGKLRTYFNLMITMLLGGLWHGASWGFVLWGGLHGAGLMINKIFSPKITVTNEFHWKHIPAWLMTFLFITLCWVLFRFPDLNSSSFVFQRLFLGSGLAIRWIYTPMFIIFAMVFVTHIIGLRRKNPSILFDLSTFKGMFLLIFVLMGIYFLSPTNTSPFIYMQF
ncbi:MAG: MBOAT family O-acyltransferase [Verrucomicrobiota bacterium]